MAAVGSRDLAVQIAARLNDLQMKQSVLARKLKLDPSIIQLWAKGKRPVPASRLDALAEALGCTPAVLIAYQAVGEDAPPVPVEAPVEEIAPIDPNEGETRWMEARRLALWQRQQQLQALVLAQRVAEDEQRARDRKRWPENPSAAVGGPLRGPERVPGRPEGDWVQIVGGLFEFVERVA